MSVNEKMTLLADAVRAKSGTTGPLSIDGMTTAVNSITVGSGIDTSDATAYAAYILSPYTAYARGGKITGTMANNGYVDQSLTPLNSSVHHSGGYFSAVNVRVDNSVNRTFTPSKEKQEYDGYDEGKFLTTVTVNPIPDEYITTSDATAAASDIATGKTAYVKGELVTGTGVEPVYYKCLDSNLVSPAYATASSDDWYTISSNSGVGHYAFMLGNAGTYWDAYAISDADGKYSPAQLKIQFTEKKKVDGYRIKFYNNGSLVWSSARINLYGVTSTSNLVLLDSLSGEDYVGVNEIRREISSGTYSAYVLEFTDDLLVGSGRWQVSELALYCAESNYWAGYKAYKDGDDYRFKIAVTDRLVFTGDTPPSPGKCYSSDGFVEVNLSGSPWGSDTTATTADIVKEKTAYIMGERVVGTMPDSEITIEDNIVTVTAGRVVENATATIPEMTITNDGKNITVPVGYNKAEQTFTVGDGIDTSDATATASDISAGVTAYVKGELVTGTLEDVTAVIDGATVTIPAGRIRKEQTLTVQKGSVAIYGNKVSVVEGYVKTNTLTVPAGSVALSADKTRVIVDEGYVKPQEIPLPGGFQLVKVTNYHPAREGFTAPSQIVISGIGTIGSDDYGTDGSAANGTYVITEDTKYQKGYARVYKQVDGKYYLAGYDSSAAEWAEYSSQWFIGTSTTSYGWSALLYYEGADIPAGEATWKNMDYGSATVTTAITNTEISSLTETALAQSVTTFDPETAEWTEGEAVDISSYSITPQTNGIYFVQDGKLIGQHIDRELHIPEDGLIRRFKAVDGHFVDKMWGTEMMPHGDISYDELGYCGNSAAPLGNGTSYLSCVNTLAFGGETTIGAFFKYLGGNAGGVIFGVGDKSSYATLSLRPNSVTVGGSTQVYFDTGMQFGKWNHLLMTVKRDPENSKNVTFKVYSNGKMINTITNTQGNYINGSSIGILSASACSQYSEALVGQVDEACVWNRILTDEEIADMAKGLEGFNWDIPVKPYVNKKPLMYASLSEQSDLSDSGQQLAYTGTVSFVTSGDRQCARIEGQNNFIHVKPADDPYGRYNINNKFTLAAWIRATDPENHSAFITFSGGYCGDQPTSTSLVNEVWLGCGKTVNLRDGSANYTMIPTNIDGSVWRHMTATWDGTQFKLYVDGVFAGSYVGHGHSFTNYLWLYINSLERAPQAVSGYGEYADVCLYDKVLSPEEISELYNGTLF